MVQVRTGLIAVDVHQHADAHLHAVCDVEFAGTDQGYITKTERTCRRRGELTVEIVCGGKQATDDLVVLEVIAFEHLRHKCLRLGIDLYLGVLVAGRRAT